MQYTRVYVDARGETHYEEVEVALSSVEFARLAPPIYLSALCAATRWGFCQFPAGWVGPWHLTPHRQFFCLLSGETAVQVSDGEVRQFGPGSMVLFEDTTGKGHLSRVVGPTEAVAVVVQLPADRPGEEGRMGENGPSLTIDMGSSPGRTSSRDAEAGAALHQRGSRVPQGLEVFQISPVDYFAR
jgi:hypothetical protein